MEFFDTSELVCPHAYRVHGDAAMKFADPRMLKWLAWFRAAVMRPVYVNNYQWGGDKSQRGYRCNLCQLVKNKTTSGQLYLSAHTRFQAVDFAVKDMGSEETRQWIAHHANQMPVNIRVERGTIGWVHVDVSNITGQKIIYFNG